MLILLYSQAKPVFHPRLEWPGYPLTGQEGYSAQAPFPLELGEQAQRYWGPMPGGGYGNPLQCSCLENPHGQRSLAGYSLEVAKSDTTERLSTAQHSTCLFTSRQDYFKPLCHLKLGLPNSRDICLLRLYKVHQNLNYLLIQPVQSL